MHKLSCFNVSSYSDCKVKFLSVFSTKYLNDISDKKVMEVMMFDISDI